MNINHIASYRYIKDRYIFYNKLGEGAYGVVYKAYDNEKKIYVAIKEHRKFHLDIFKELTDKWTLWVRINHPNVVKYYDYWLCRELSVVYVVMEYLNGYSLRAVSLRGNGFDYYLRKIMKIYYTKSYNDIMWSIMLKVIDGLFYLHRNKIVHRDLKPDNIVLTLDSIPKIVDLDFLCIADHRINSRIKCNGTNIGTPLYKAPEYLLSSTNIDSIEYMRNDIWGVGATFYYYYFGHDYLKEAWKHLDMTGFIELFKQMEGKEIIRNPTNNIEVYINWILNTDYTQRPTAKECLDNIKRISKER